MASPNEQNSKTQDVAKQVAEAHSLLVTLRGRLDKHPELEDAIRRLGNRAGAVDAADRRNAVNISSESGALSNEP